MLISFTGRKSGKPYSTPINYVREGDTITLIGNARGVVEEFARRRTRTVIVQGKEQSGTAEAAIPDDQTIIAELQKVYSGIPRGYAEKLVSNTVVIRVHLN